MIIILLILLLATPCAASDWIWYNTVGEVACELAIYADWRTTREFTGNPHEYPYMYEENNVLGQHPSARRVNLYAGLYMIAHPIISWALPQPLREGWQAGTFFISISAANHNHESGVTLNMRFF